MTRLSCASCEHWRTNGCAINCPGWPNVGDFCEQFSYEPGVDEADWETGAETAQDGDPVGLDG